MEKKYDIVIVGTGVAGRTFAGKVAHSGLKIAIIDSREYGGTCPLRGCDPKEVLTDIAHYTDSINRLRDKGVGTGTLLRIDWPLLIKFKRTFTEGYPAKIEKNLIDKGIDTYHGRAYFENQNTHIIDMYHAGGMNLVYNITKVCYVYPENEFYELLQLQNIEELHEPKYDWLLMKGMYGET